MRIDGDAETATARNYNAWSRESLHMKKAASANVYCRDFSDIRFREAIRVAGEQKSISLEKRAEATWAEYRRQKVNG
jgi:hypothetical protein